MFLSRLPYILVGLKDPLNHHFFDGAEGTPLYTRGIPGPRKDPQGRFPELLAYSMARFQTTKRDPEPARALAMLRSNIIRVA